MRRHDLLPVPLALVLVSASLVTPASAGAYVFWNTDSGSIGRTNNDGSAANPMFIAGAESAESIAVDSSHLYYTTNLENEVGELPVARTDLEGGEASLQPESGEGIAAVDGDYVYWRSNLGIGRARLDGSDREPEFLPVGAELGDIAVYSGYAYWTYYNGGFGETIGRASLGTKLVEPEYIHFEVPEAAGPRAIAVDS